MHRYSKIGFLAVSGTVSEIFLAQTLCVATIIFNEQKEFQKIEREIKELEFEKKQIEQLFADGKVTDDAIEKKANELQEIIKKLEEKEERWFELSSKIE